MALYYLLLSIIFSTFINLIFRVFTVFKIHKFQAIVVNYLACFLIGFLLSDYYEFTDNLNSNWFSYCLLLGCLFVAIFLSMAMTTDKYGVSVNAVCAKMSVVIPVIFAYFYMDESISYLFVLGLILSLLSIYLISKKEGLNISGSYAYLPVIVFVGSGVIDTALKLLQSSFSEVVPLSVLSYSIFLGAFTVGFILYFFMNRFSLKSWKFRNIGAGILLGIPNYFSIYFLLLAIREYGDQSAFVFGFNNIGIVLLSTLLSVVFFHEKLSTLNKIGILVSTVSITIIAYAS